MKTNKNVNYKARLWADEKGELHGVSFGNRQIPMGLFGALNTAMHEVVDTFNGKNAWKENYIKLLTTARDMSSLMAKMLIRLVPIVFSVVNDANILTITTAVKDIVVNHIEK